MHLPLKSGYLLVIWLASTMAQSDNAFPTSAKQIVDVVPSRETSMHCGKAPKLSKSDFTNTERAKQTSLKDGQVSIEANQAHYQPDKQIELEGDVEIVRGSYHASSDSATVNQASEQAELKGGVELRGPDLILKGDTATLDMINERMRVRHASFLKPSSQMNGEAREISRPDQHTLVIKDGIFTTCHPENRSWSFASSEIILDQDSGFGTATHTRFRIFDTPVFYLPWFSFPIDEQRKTGFLYPEIGSSNTESGMFFSTPYYFNFGPQDDATLTPTFINGRGLHTELEARHLNTSTHSTLAIGYIENDQHYVDTINAEQPALQNSNIDGERWGLNFEQDIDLNTIVSGWHGEIDYSAVSDNDYLDDLNQGLHIDDQDRLDRRAIMFLSRDDWQFSVLFQQYKSLDDSVLPSDEVFQRLPEMNLQAHQGLETFQLDWQSQYVYFYRDDRLLAADERSYGSRFRHQPTLSLPYHRQWGFVKPSVTIDHTDYLLRGYTPEEDHISRTVPMYALDAGLFFDRRTSFFSQPLKQSLEPRIHYVYAQDKAQDDIPNFDTSIPGFHYRRLFNTNRFTGGDRIGDSNRLTVGLTSRWSDPKTGLDQTVLSFGQIYHYDPQKVGLNGVGRSNQKESLLASEILIRPFSGVDINASGLWDSRDDTTREGNSQISFHSPNYQTVLNLSHRYIRSELEQLDSSIIFPVSGDLSLMGRWRYDLQDKRSIGTLAGVEYSSCCWRIQLLSQSYLTDESKISNSILFQFQLKGIGGFGVNADSMDQQIPGYNARETHLN